MSKSKCLNVQSSYNQNKNLTESYEKMGICFEVYSSVLNKYLKDIVGSYP